MLRNKITTAIKSADNGNEKKRLSFLRLIQAVIKDHDAAVPLSNSNQKISDEAIYKLLQEMIDERQTKLDFYQQTNREKLALIEKEEIALIYELLPKPLTQQETLKAIDDAIAKLNANSIRDVGAIMQYLKQRYLGQINFSECNKIVKSRFVKE